MQHGCMHNRVSAADQQAPARCLDCGVSFAGPTPPREDDWEREDMTDDESEQMEDSQLDDEEMDGEIPVFTCALPPPLER